MLYIMTYKPKGTDIHCRIENDLEDVRRVTQSLVQSGYSLAEIDIYEVEKHLVAKIEFIDVHTVAVVDVA